MVPTSIDYEGAIEAMSCESLTLLKYLLNGSGMNVFHSYYTVQATLIIQFVSCTVIFAYYICWHDA